MSRNNNKSAKQAKGSRNPGARRAAGGQQGSKNALQQAPLSMSRVRVNPPKARNSMQPNGNRTIVFEEYVQDIITSGTTLAFSVNSFPVQPGIPTLFAWLAEQAVNYQEYRFRRISFRFETDQQASIAGKVMYAFSPDAADGNPANKQEMLEYGVKGKSAVWQEFELPIPLLEALGDRRYIRSGTLADNLDIKTYDLGILFVATSGVVATSANIGELYVKYEVELITPVVQSAAIALARSATITGATAISETVLFGTAPTTTGGLAVVASTTDATLTFNRVGNYIVNYRFNGTGLFTAFAPTFSSQVGCTVTAINGIANAGGDVGTVSQGSFLVVVSARGATFLLDVTSQATTITGSVLRISTYVVS